MAVQAAATIVSELVAKVLEHITWIDGIRRDVTLHYGQQIGIRACDGFYIMCDLTHESKLHGRERHIREWELFEIVEVSCPFASMRYRPVRYNDKITFRAINNGNFVGCDLENRAEIAARVPNAQSWETFTLIKPDIENYDVSNKIVQFGAPFALRAENNGSYVRYSRDDDKGLYADIPHGKAYEIFHFINPQDPK